LGCEKKARRAPRKAPIVEFLATLQQNVSMALLRRWGMPSPFVTLWNLSNSIPGQSQLYLSSDDFVVVPDENFVDEQENPIDALELRTEKRRVSVQALLLRALFEMLRATPMVDHIDRRFSSGAAACADLKERFGIDAFDLQLYKPHSDEGLSLLVTQGLCAPYVTRTGTGPAARIVVDYEWMRSLPIRSGYRSYGGRLVLDSDFAPLCICDGDREYTPADGHSWELAKFLFRSTTIQYVTTVWHIAVVHVTVHQALVTSLALTWPRFDAQRRQTACQHVVPGILARFAYNGQWISWKMNRILTRERGIPHRIFAFTYASLKQVWEFGRRQARLNETFAESLSRRGFDEAGASSGYAYAEDGVLFWDALFQPILRYVTGFYAQREGSPSEDRAVRRWLSHMRRSFPRPDEQCPNRLETAAELATFMTSIVVHVTAIHELSGNVGSYISDPSIMSASLRPGSTIEDMMSGAGEFWLSNMTGLRTHGPSRNLPPLMLFDVPGETASAGEPDKLLQAFEQDIRSSCAKLEIDIRRNTARRKQTHLTFLPSYLRATAGY
jgi:hypothetical protein